MMAAAQMPRPFPPMSYHTPQSNSPASVASPSGHDQHRSMYAQPPSHLQQQSMYYGAQQAQYPSMPPQAAASPYAQHAQQSHQPMPSQPGMMMSHAGAQHQIPQHATQHAQAGMTGSPRHAKMEPQVAAQLQRPAPGPIAAPQHAQNGTTIAAPTASTPGVNPNAAPGPIPATTPLVVRQDQNGVQWIAFEYSRDRVKMEYTIRCDVESVNTDELSAEFKTENCVYPRACCPKDQYRGNRLQYETECNTVGWALAQLNACLRGKRGLIQRAVDSWRNSNQDPRLRSRRVRRMAKMNTRKTVQNTPHTAPHMAGPSGPAGMPTPGTMAPGGAAAMGKPGMGNMGAQMHHHAHPDGNGQSGGDEVGDGDSYTDDQQLQQQQRQQQQQQHHHHQAPAPQSSSRGTPPDVRPTQVFGDYATAAYPSNAPSGSTMPPLHDVMGGGAGSGPAAASAAGGSPRRIRSGGEDEPTDLFPDIPEAKKRKFILVEDNARGSNRLRIRVTLDAVDTKEIPDSFRKSSSVYPRSYFPREMQSPPPSATGSRFFADDPGDSGEEEDDDDEDEDEDGNDRGGAGGDGRPGNAYGGGRRVRKAAGAGGRRAAADRATMVKVPVGDNGAETEVAIPRIRRSTRGREVRLNDLGYRMAWLQSRVFAGRTIFLQRSLDCYRNKVRTAIESIMQEVKTVAPHYETRVGKRKWNERVKRGDKRDDDA